MTKQELDELAKQEQVDDWTMNSGCTDYVCYCHAKVPVLVAEIRRLRAGLRRVRRLGRDGDECVVCGGHDDRCEPDCWLDALLKGGG